MSSIESDFIADVTKLFSITMRFLKMHSLHLKFQLTSVLVEKWGKIVDFPKEGDP